MGTNDVGKYTTADAYAALIDQMMSMPDAEGADRAGSTCTTRTNSPGTKHVQQGAA